MKIELLILARWVITVDQHDTVLENHAIAINEGKIVSILPQALAKQHYQAQQIINLPQHALCPGFVNAHTHAAMSLLKGLADDLPLMEWLQHHIWPAEARWVDPLFVYQGTQLAIAEMIRSGTTCFNDMYFFPEAALQAVQESGIRANLGLIALDFPSIYAQSGDEYLSKAQALLPTFTDHPTISAVFAPHAPYTTSDRVLRQLATLMQAYPHPMHMHVHETALEVAEAERQQGMRPLQRLDQLGLLNSRFIAVHMTQLNADEIALLAKRGVHVVHCPESNLKLASGFCPVAELLAAGVNVALGTDGSASNNDLDMLGEMRTAALLAKGVAQDARVVNARQVLRMATINGAQALGLAQSIGSLEIGKYADIIAFDFNTLDATPMYDPISHLVYCTDRGQIRYSWVAGNLLLAQRKLTTLDETLLMKNAQSWHAKLSAKETA